MLRRFKGRAIMLVVTMLLSGVASILRPPAAFADAAPLQALGRTIVPKQHSKVRMAEEEVNIVIIYDPALGMRDEADGRQVPDYLPPYRGVVTATFVFSAPAEEKVLVGFPLGMILEDKYMSGEVTNFSASIDGKPVLHRTERVRRLNGPEETWAVWEVDFARGQTKIDVRYEVPFETYRPWSDVPFGYVLETGRYWEGTIGRALITLETRLGGEAIPLGPSHVRPRTTPGYEVKNGRIEWDFRDTEPDFDIHIQLAPVLFERQIGLACEMAQSTSAGHTYENLSRAAYAVSRYMMYLDEYTISEIGLDKGRISQLLSAGAALHRKCIVLRPEDLAIRESFFNLLLFRPEVDSNPGLLKDYFSELARLDRPSVYERDFGSPSDTTAWRRAVRLYAMTDEQAVQEIVLDTLKGKTAPERFSVTAWSGDISGRTVPELEAAQQQLRQDLEKASRGALEAPPSSEPPRVALYGSMILGVFVICGAVALLKIKQSVARKR